MDIDGSGIGSLARPDNRRGKCIALLGIISPFGELDKQLDERALPGIFNVVSVTRNKLSNSLVSPMNDAICG